MTTTNWAPLLYCFKCREKREIQRPEQVRMKNGRPALQGKCGECGMELLYTLVEWGDIAGWLCRGTLELRG